MAIVISFIVFLGLTDTILVAVDANVRNALRGEAGRVAEETMNAARALPFDNIVVPSASLPASSSVSRVFQRMTMNYAVTRNVTNAGPDMKQILITVSWNRGVRTDNANRSVTLTTIVRKR